MSITFKKQLELFVLAFLFPLIWLLATYFINPFWFAEDKFGSIRFLVFFFLIYFYYKPMPNYNLKFSIIELFLIFVGYLISFYVVDVLINFVFDVELKFEYYQQLYTDAIDGAEEELKSINADYKMSSKDEMIASFVNNHSSMGAYIKNILLDILKICLLSILIAVIFRKKYNQSQFILLSSKMPLIVLLLAFSLQ